MFSRRSCSALKACGMVLSRSRHRRAVAQKKRHNEFGADFDIFVGVDVTRVEADVHDRIVRRSAAAVPVMP